jgi:hypothetical protein
MPFTYVNDEGVEVEAYTADEIAQERSAREAAIADAAEARQALKDKTQDVFNMRQGFKKLEEMSEEEKAKLTEEQRVTMQRLETVEAARQRDLQEGKEALFDRLSGNDPKVKEKLKEKYALVQMPETTLSEISARLQSVSTWAFAELGMVNNAPVAPVLPGNGGAPIFQNKDGKRFADTPQGDALGNALFGEALKANE